jgi:hypothetical protein
LDRSSSNPLDLLESDMIDLEAMNKRAEAIRLETDKSICEVITLALDEWRQLYPAYERMRRVGIALSQLSFITKHTLPEPEASQIKAFLALRESKPRKPWTRKNKP